MGKPSAPPPPDYVGAAQAQGATNLETAKFNASAARPDEYGVEGSRTWTLKPGADPKNPQPGDYILTTTLSPEQQQLYNSGTAISQNLINTGQSGLDRVSSALGEQFSLGGLPGVSTVGGGGGVPVAGINPSALPNAPQLQTALGADAPALPTDAAATRDRVTQAIIQRNMPQLEQAAQGARTRSIAAGGDVGSESYGRTEDANDRARNDFLLAADASGQSAANDEIRNQLALRGQAQGEMGASNAALSQMFGQGLARSGQEFGQNLQAGGFANSADAQAFQQLLQGSGFDNQARQQMIQDLLLQRQQPLNEVNALRTGSQVSMPQFTSGGPTGNAQGAPIFDATVAQGQADQALYGQKMQGYNNTAQLGALAALMYFSDARLKENIKRVGSTDDGRGVYTWEWSDTAKAIGAAKQPGFGVMAQEHPEATIVDPRTGFLKVDYSKVG